MSVPGLSIHLDRESAFDRPKKILLSPLHIKIGLIKQFVTALDKEKDCFKYLVTKSPKITSEKIKTGIFIGPQYAS